MDIETNISAESGVHVHVSEWEDGAFIKISVDRASIYTSLANRACKPANSFSASVRVKGV